MSTLTEARGVVPPPGRAAPAAEFPPAGFIPSQDGDPARAGTARVSSLGALSPHYPGRVANEPGPAGGFSA
jgi:hypothetical protein